VFSWLFNNALGSLLLVQLFHIFANTWITLLPRTADNVTSSGCSTACCCDGGCRRGGFRRRRLSRKPSSELPVILSPELRAPHSA